MEPPNITHSGSNIEWKKKALERSYHAGQRYTKHMRKVNKFVPRLKTRGDATKPNSEEASKSLAYEEDIRLNSLISNLPERSEFGITMEEDDDITDSLLPDGLVETIPEDSASELVLLSVPREVATMSPEVLGCVTIDGFAFRTFPTESSEETSSSWIKTEPDVDVKPSIDELNRVRCPTKTTDITKIKGWRNKVFAENDEFIVKEESEENWDASNSLVDESSSLNFTRSAAASMTNDTENVTLLNCALTLPYTKSIPTAQIENISSKKRARLSNCSPERQAKKTKFITNSATEHILPTTVSPTVQPITGNPAKKPKTKAEYRRMLEEAARSSEASDADKAPATPPVKYIKKFERAILPKGVPNTGHKDSHLQINYKIKGVDVTVVPKHELDARFMYALVDGRPIKIGGSTLAKRMADSKLVVAAKPVTTSPPKIVDARYTSLLPQTETPKSVTPIVKHKNRGRPLSRKLETKEKRLQEFCLRVHPTVGFPLTETAFEQISLLRNDRMDINEDWINFATTVVDSKKKTVYHRKGFVDNVIPTSDILLPVRVTRSGNRYESINRESFNTIKVPTAQPSKVTVDEENTYPYESYLKDRGDGDCDINLLLQTMVDTVAKQVAVEDLYQQAEPGQDGRQSKESPTEPHDFLNPARAAAYPRKRRSALNSELRRLNVLVIEERDTEIEEMPEASAQPADVPACKQEHCKFGCLCHSLERSATEANHCGRPDCMFECVCSKPSGAEDHSMLPKSIVSKINESTKYLARTEKEFQRAVVCNKNEMLVVDGCAAPATGRRKREVKLPLRFRESGIDDKLLFGGNANLQVMEARKNEKKVEDLQSENITIKTEEPAVTNKDLTFGLGGRPFFVPNHVKHSEFFRRRAENRVFEQQHALDYQLKPSKVVIFRAKLDNVQPFCILHNIHACPCLQYMSTSPAETSCSQASPTRSPTRKLNAQPFHRSDGKWRNVAVKKTAPRFFPSFPYRNRCSRTEGVDLTYVIRNRKLTYKATLKGHQEEFRARLYGDGKSVLIPGNHILQNIQSRSDTLEDRVLQEISDEEAGRGGSSSDASSHPVCKENTTYLSKTLPNSIQRNPSSFKPSDTPASTMLRVPAGSETKMMRWSLLQDGFLNNSLQMWLSSPEIGSPRLYVSTSLKAPDVKCRNLRNWTGKTERGYPPLVKELMEQIPDESAGEKIRYGILLKSKDHWEVLGISRQSRQQTAVRLGGRPKMVKFLKENAVMSVPLPVIPIACRWHVINIDCRFDRIVFKGCVIVEKDIIELSDVSQTENCVNAILFTENFPVESKSLNLLPKFGLYSLPKICECVFLGPFRLDGTKGDAVTMFRDVTAKGGDSTTRRIFVEVVQPKSESAWLYAEGQLDDTSMSILNSVPKSLPVINAVAQHEILKRSPNESSVRRKLAAAVEHTYKSPTIAASSLKKMNFSPALQRSRINAIAAKKVAASKTFARRCFLANNPGGLPKPSVTEISPSSATKRSPMSLLKVALSVTKDEHKQEIPSEDGVEEIATTPAENIIGSTPILPKETVSLSPVKLAPQPAKSQNDAGSIQIVSRTKFLPSTIETSSSTKKTVSQDVSNVVRRLSLQVGRDNPPSVTLLQRRSSVESEHSRTPSVNSSGLSASNASSCNSVSNAGDTNVSSALVNRPGLTITKRTSGLSAAADSCSKVPANTRQVVNLIDSDNDVQFISNARPAADEECDIIVMPSGESGTVPTTQPDEYEPAVNTTQPVVEMSTLDLERTTRVKYVPSIPSLGYVEANRLTNNKLRIRFLNKTFVEVTVSSNGIRQYLDKSIRNNPLLLVEPPDLPLTWELTEDMTSFPEVPPFNYAETFDGNHMLCEKGLMRRKVTQKATEARGKARDVDMIALERLKNIIKAPNISGVSLEETLSQAAGIILQCNRLEQDLEYKLDWWQRRRKKTWKRLFRLILTLPDKEEQRPWFTSMDAILKTTEPRIDPTMEVIDLVDDADDNGNNRDVVDLSETEFSLSGYTPRRLQAILFPTDEPLVSHAPVRNVSNKYDKKLASLLKGQPTRPSVSLLRNNLYPTVPSVQTVIPVMDLTEDDAQPKVVMQKRPELPVVILDDDDDKQTPLPKPSNLSNKVDKPNQDQMSFSYGVNSSGHYFRCALLGNKIVNKVRITKVPDNVQCRKIVPANAGTIARDAAGNAYGTIASVVSGTQMIGIRLSDALQQGKQAASNETIMSEMPDTNQQYRNIVPGLPTGVKLTNSRLGGMQKLVGVTDRRNSTSYQEVGQKPHIVPSAVNALVLHSNQTGRNEVTKNGTHVFRTICPTERTAPTTVQLALSRMQSSQVAPISDALQSLGQIPDTSDAITIINKDYQPEETEYEPIKSSAVENARAVFDQLLTTSKLKENTRQIIIKGPFTNTPNILKRSSIKQKTPEMKDIHVQLNLVRADPEEQPSKSIKSDKQIVKLSHEEIQRLSSLKVIPGKPITLKLKTAPTLTKMICKTYEREGSQSSSKDAEAENVETELSISTGNPMALPTGDADDDNEHLVIDEEADERGLITEEGLILETEVNLDHSETVRAPTEVNTETVFADSEEIVDLGVQVNTVEDANLSEDQPKSDLETTQASAVIVSDDSFEKQDSTVAAALLDESASNLEIPEPTEEEQPLEQ